MDYCGICNTDDSTNASNNSDKRVVRLKFLRNQLLYDIKIFFVLCHDDEKFNGVIYSLY